jgi:hypothetical protein
MIRTWVDLCNKALTYIGEGRIGNMEESTEPAQLCGLLYEQARDEVLSAHPWASSLAYARLAEVVDEENLSGYTHCYQIPTTPGCLQIRRVFSPDSGIIVSDWQRRGDKIYCNAESPALDFIQQIETPKTLTPALAEAMVLRLAYRLSYRLSTDKQLMASLLQMYEFQLQRAKQEEGAEALILESDFSWSES